MSLFFRREDYQLMLDLNREFINDVVDTPVILYKLNVLKTDTNSYGESIEKTWYSGVQIPALIRITKEEASTDIGTVNIIQEFTVSFLRDELEQRNIVPEIGDIIEWYNQYYEVHNPHDTQFWGGQTNNNLAVICDCHLTKKSNLQFERPQL